MKRRNIFTASSILILIMALLISTTQAAFAAETTDAWVTKASMNTPRKNFKCESINGKIYAIGGQDENYNFLASVEEYDSNTDTWSIKKSMLNGRQSLQTEIINGKIYALGGTNYNGYPAAIEVYDPNTDTWTAKKSMSVPRLQFKTEVLNGKIYAIGGISNAKALSSVEVYDPDTDTWTTKKSMFYERNNLQTEIINGKIYAIGGDNSNGYLSSVEVYDPDTDTWTTKKSMSVQRSHFSTETIGSKIYAIGGRDALNFFSSIEEYDPNTDTWTTKKSMAVKKCPPSTLVIGKKIYAVGGGSAQLEEYDLETDTWTKRASMITQGSGEAQLEVISGKIYAIGCSSTSSVEAYTISQSDPTLTLTASSDKVKVGQQFTTAIDIHNVTNICAEDIKITYDTDLFTYEGVEAQTGLKIYKEDTSIPGTIRFISACQGKENAATGDKGLITLKFTAKKQGTGKIDIIKGRIADNATLEEDVAEANCGEDTVTVEGYADVNRNGEFTLLDLGIDGWYNGMNAADTDTTKFSADVVVDGKIDDNDLAEITKGILANSNYTFNS